MPFKIKEISNYLNRHKYYLTHLYCDIFKLLWWKVCRKRIAVITTGSGGVGDYLWIRNYMPPVSQKGFKIVLIAMAHWKDIVETFDKSNANIIRYFESCQSPRKIETIFFKLFIADIYLNFRQKSISDFVKYKRTYNDSGLPNDLFYEEKNNQIFNQFAPLSERFRHTLPIIPLTKDTLPRPFVVFTERGNTQGSLSIEQSSAIVKCLAERGYNILLNGNIKRLKKVLNNKILEMIIDGSHFTFPQYTYLVNESTFVVTVNTSIYHFALQFAKPCVVISANEYETIKLDAANQKIIFDKKLQQAFENGDIKTYNKNESAKLSSIECSRLTNIINDYITSFNH